MPEISVLIPTRAIDGDASLLRGMTSLLARAADSTRIDFWLAIDPDRNLSVTVPSAARCAVLSVQRNYGPSQVHRYYNEIAARAQGRWLLPWHEAAVMKTRGWDQVLADTEDGCAVMMGSRRFTAWPRAWHDVLGSLSPDPLTGPWLHKVADSAGLLVTAGIRVQMPHEAELPAPSAPVDRAAADLGLRVW